MKIRELSLLFYSLFLVAVVLLYLIYTKQGTEGFEPISNFDDERIQKNPLPRINCEPGDRKITVTWTQNNSSIKQYLIAVRPVRQNKQSIMYKVHENPQCVNCEAVIGGLKNGELYEVRMILFLKDKKEGETLSFMSTRKIKNITKNYFTKFDKNLTKYLGTF